MFPKRVTIPRHQSTVAAALSLFVSVGAADAATTVKFRHGFNKFSCQALGKIIVNLEAPNPGIDIEDAVFD